MIILKILAILVLTSFIHFILIEVIKLRQIDMNVFGTAICLPVIAICLALIAF